MYMLSLSFCLSLFVILSIFLCVFLSLTVSLTVSVCLCVSLCVSVCLCVFISLSLCLCLPVSLCLSVSASVSASSHSLHQSLVLHLGCSRSFSFHNYLVSSDCAVYCFAWKSQLVPMSYVHFYSSTALHIYFFILNTKHGGMVWYHTVSSDEDENE